VSDIGRLYEFAFRGILADVALDSAGRKNLVSSDALDMQIAARLSIETLDEAFVGSARRMATVYVAVAAFENSARKLIETVLLDKKGANWWQSAVSKNIRKRAESRRDDEIKHKWHGQRGDSLINYTDLAQLGNIIGQNWPLFEAFFVSLEWVKNIFDVIERSRNVIMHSGTLDVMDIERVGIHIRDWVKQVGA
jgi:hypothetical protein